MTNLRQHHRFLTLVSAILILLTVAPGAAPARGRTWLPTIDFNWITDFEHYREPVEAALSTELALLPAEGRLTVSAGRMNERRDWALLVLVPTRVVESGWTVPFARDEVVRVILQLEDGAWRANLLDRRSTSFAPLASRVPKSFIDLSEPRDLVQGLKFPWTSDETWKRGGLRWHEGNALDFRPTGADTAVLAADGGLLDCLCDDGEQVQLVVDHFEEQTGYLHLDADSVHPCDYGQIIPRGWFLGDIFGIPDESFITPCGKGSWPHLHLTVFKGTATDPCLDCQSLEPGPCPACDLVFDGNLIDDVARAPAGSDTFTSTNAVTEPCKPGAADPWIVDSSCIMDSSETASGDVIVRDSSELTLFPCTRLDIDFETSRLDIEHGSRVRIRDGAKIH